MDEIESVYLQRTLTLIRASEGEAVAVAKRLRKANDFILKNVEVTFTGKVTKKNVETLKKSVTKTLFTFYQNDLPKELLKISSEVIAKEVAWNANILENIRNGNLTSSRVVRTPAPSILDGYDTETPMFRGVRDGAVTKGRFFSDNSDYANLYAKHKIEDAPALAKVYLPKKGALKLSRDVEIREDFFRLVARPATIKRIAAEKGISEAQALIEFRKKYFNPDGELLYEHAALFEKYAKAKKVEWTSIVLDEKNGQLSRYTSSDDVAKSVFVAPSKEIVKSFVEAATNKKYQGKLFGDWIIREFKGNAGKVNKALNSGFLSGKNVAEMTRDVKNITGSINRNAKTITRSFFMHNAREAKESVFKLNPDLVEAEIWLSTLDSRTTPLICGVRDGQEYTIDTHEPIGHPFPWDNGPSRIHWNCRSTSIPKVKNIATSFQRAAVGAGDNYSKGDNTTRTGKVRKPLKASREKGIYKIEMKTQRTKYEGWLKSESKDNIDFVSDILGNENARLFRDGKVTLKDLMMESPIASTIRLTDV